MLNNLEYVRKNKNITMTQISNLLGIQVSTVSDKIKGKSHFNFDEALKIQRVLFPEYNLEFLFKDFSGK